MASIEQATTDPHWTTGDRFRRARLDAKISVQEMADRMGVHRNVVGLVENDRQDPPMRRVRQWAEITGTPVAWLLGSIETTPTRITTRYLQPSLFDLLAA